MKKQYIVQKYVMADSAEDAVKKSKSLPIHEVYVHSSWFEKQNAEFFAVAGSSPLGFKEKDKIKNKKD